MSCRPRSRRARAGALGTLLVLTGACGPDAEPRPGTRVLAAEPGAVPAEPAPPVAPRFEPRLSAFHATQTEVRPGDAFAFEVVFENAGGAPAEQDLVLFMHFEEVTTTGCRDIAFQKDRRILDRPTYTWAPGERVVIGPRVFEVPYHAREGRYRIHLGLFDRLGDGARVLDAVAGEIAVSHAAPTSEEWQPEPLPEEELEQRRAALATRITAPVELAAEAWRLVLDRASGAFRLEDRKSGIAWHSDPAAPRWGALRLGSRGRSLTVPVVRFDSIERDGDALVARVAPAHPELERDASVVELEVRYEPIARGQGLRVTCTTRAQGAWHVDAIEAFDRALCATDVDEGATILPRYLGLLLPASSGLPSSRSFATCDSITLGMLGRLQRGSALLAAWSHPGVTAWHHVSSEEAGLAPGKRMHSSTFVLAEGASSFELYPLGAGDYNDVARAYRRHATQRGERLTFALRRQRWPRSEYLAGAAIFRPGVLDRMLPGTPFNAGTDEQVLVNYTFDEVARVAEHWRHDLELDRALVILTGWNRRGYDNQLPDILPANEECGGNLGLADCGRRIQALDYLFGLHDNYLDVFTDAPSFDPALVAKSDDGTYKAQRIWSGGLSYQACSSQQPVLAARNWPVMRELFAPDLVYLDTTLLAALATCDDPAHPVERLDDQQNKRRLLELAREHFPLVGSEGGSEWGVPYAELFGGLLTHKTLGSLGRTVIPLVPMVYGDCVAIGTMQGDRIGIGDADKFLTHVLYAEMPIYDVGDHLYFEQPSPSGLPVRARIADFEAISAGVFRLRYRWEVAGPLPGADHQVFVHFIHRRSEQPERVSFQDDHYPPVPTSQWRAGDVIDVGPREIAIPEELEGRFEIWIGLAENGRRKLFVGLPSQSGRHRVGSLVRRGDTLEFEDEATDPQSRCFARADGGWGEHLGDVDRLIKNTWEVLSWLDRVTIDRPMTGHAFLAEGVERTTFGGVTVTVNYSAEPYAFDDTVLPKYGFLVAGATFEAFHATRHRGVEYPGGALFTLRSLDEAPLAEAASVRVYHGFGPSAVRLGERLVEVPRDAVVTR